jgi:exonuclease III
MMKIVTWNVRACSPEKARKRTLPSLIEHRPDICVLTEVVSGKPEDALREGLELLGYQTLTAISVAKEMDAKGVLIASREYILPSQIRGMEMWGRKCVAAHTFGLEIAGLYFPQHDDRADMLESLQSGMNDALLKDAVLLGDFNMGVRIADGFSSDEYVRKGKCRIVHDAYETFHRSSGWIDMWRKRNPNDYSVGSWLSPKNHFRVDHMFFSPTLAQKVLGIGYSHKEREGANKVSDHSLMWAELELPSAAT